MAIIAGCANPALRQADDLAAANQPVKALAVIEEAIAQDPADRDLRMAQQRLRERAASQLILQIEALRMGGRYPDALALLEKLRAIEPKHPRLGTLQVELVRAQRQDKLLAEARQALQANRLDTAEAKLREVTTESPGHPGVRLLQQQLSERLTRDTSPAEMGPAFQKPITLEFRDAPLRTIFESLARTSNLNFVFDREVKGDSKVTVFLRNVTIDEALRVILTTQQLDRKLLNPETVMVFPNNQGKQRELQDLVTRTLYLANANVKEAEKMVKTIAKIRDVFIDERLNLMVLRDTPEVVRLVERLVASIDLPEPEVMLEVEVMEVGSDRLDEIGLQWPEQVQFGLLNGGDVVLAGQRGDFRALVANPALVATLRGTSGTTNLLANPKIRVRNREKAKVQIGEKLPIFTTTAAVNIGVSASVSYLDVGLKLDVEPTIGLDNDVSIKLALEVSNLLGKVSGPSGSVAYQVGTRLTNTSLRLADGETQIISGLINDEDRRTAAGVPGLSQLPIAGALFGLKSNTRNKTEIVLLITPRIVRNLTLPDAALTRMPGGTDANPGAFNAQLRPSGRAGVGLNNGGAQATSTSAPRPQPPAPQPPVATPATALPAITVPGAPPPGDLPSPSASRTEADSEDKP